MTAPSAFGWALPSLTPPGNLFSFSGGFAIGKGVNPTT
jgi:hypothetical protein